MDILFINPSNKLIYQGLADSYAAIEPPTWSLLLAESCRSVGYDVSILDTNAERLADEESIERIKDVNPRLLCFVVYGQNVNAGTVSMSGAVRLADAIKGQNITIPICFVGSHVSALPHETLLKEGSIDIVLTNEGVYALRNLLSCSAFNTQVLKKVKGIGFRENGQPVLTPPETTVPNERMDFDLPGYAWDLLPYKHRPLDLYRSPMWHANYIEDARSPYASIYTSLGCIYKCSFCMINILNRNDNQPIGEAANYSSMRFWSPQFVVQEFDKLAELGVKTIRISDEMFLLNKNYYLPLCESLRERDYASDLNMWAYSRIDTVKDPGVLGLTREAGIRWLCVGIESADKNVRMEAAKGKFDDVDVVNIVQQIHGHDIDVLANYLVGLEGETQETMQRTLDLSLELCTRGWNMYAAMALPGSSLYHQALNSNYKLPNDYLGYSFHSYETVPLPSKDLTPAEILKFRDDAWMKYHTYPPFLKLVEEKSGTKAKEDILKMTQIRLRRRILGHSLQ